jgi:hypothetical protein
MNSANAAVHPDVLAVLEESDRLTERLLTSIERMRTLTAEKLSKDQDIAVKVDMSGQLVDLWFKPGLLDRKDPAAIAKEVTALAAAAVKDAAAGVDQIFQESRAAADGPANKS